jgi:hypothetical protein
MLRKLSTREGIGRQPYRVKAAMVVTLTAFEFEALQLFRRLEKADMELAQDAVMFVELLLERHEKEMEKKKPRLSLVRGGCGKRKGLELLERQGR